MHFYHFELLTLILPHLRRQFAREEKEAVLRRLWTVVEEGEKLSSQRAEIYLTELIASGYLSGQGELVNQFVERFFDKYYWRLPYEYSIKGMLFPVSKLAQKSIKKADLFKLNSTLKQAVAISIQTQLQPQSTQLLKLQEETIAEISAMKWQGLQWLTKSMIYYPELVVQFHRLYFPYYQGKVTPPQEQLQKDYAQLKIEHISNI